MLVPERRKFKVGDRVAIEWNMFEERQPGTVTNVVEGDTLEYPIYTVALDSGDWGCYFAGNVKAGPAKNWMRSRTPLRG